MVYVRSPYPPLPHVPHANAHELMFNTPGHELVEDYTLYIDAVSGRQRTFYEFKEMIRDGATALGASQSEGGLGLNALAGDVVGIYSHNCMNFVALVHSLLIITTPIALLSAYGTAFELAHALRTSKPSKLFVEPALLPNALVAAKEVGLSDSAIYILEGSVEGRTSFEDLVQHVKARGIPRVPIRPAHRNTLAYLVFSSGTSGLPKAVMISHGNLWSMMISLAINRQEEEKVIKPVPPKEPHVNLLLLPFYHTYGLHVACFRLFVIPLTNVIVPKWNVELVLRTIPKYRVNYLPLIPSAIHQLANHPLTEKINWNSVLSVGSGAAYLPPALSDKFMRFIKNTPMMSEGYGMSEQTLSAIRKPFPGMFGLQPKRGSTGLLLPGVSARIRRADGSEADYDEPGELWVRAGNVALGYYGNEKATRETFVDGWLRTGDHFKVDRDGFFFFVDRAKDTLKVSGAQVSPTEVEDALLAQPDKLILDVCVAGVPGGRTSDEKIPRAWIILSDEGKRLGAEATIKVLDDWTKQTLSRYKWLRGGYEVVDSIPKSPTGKVLRRLLQDQFEQRHAVQAKL